MDKKRLLILLLSFALIFTMMPLSVFASSADSIEGNEAPTVKNETPIAVAENEAKPEESPEIVVENGSKPEESAEKVVENGSKPEESPETVVENGSKPEESAETAVVDKLETQESPETPEESDSEEKAAEMPITVKVKNLTCEVEKTSYSEYYYKIKKAEYNASIKNGIYKVIVPSDAGEITIECKEMTHCSKVSMKQVKEVSGKITLNSKDLEKIYNTIPNAVVNGTNTNETLAAAEGCAPYRACYVNINGDETLKDGKYYADYGLLIQFGSDEEKSEKQDVGVFVEEIKLDDETKALRIGEERTVIAKIKNNGSEAVSGFKIKLRSNGFYEYETTYNGDLGAGEGADVNLKITPSATGDESKDGKTTLEVLINNQEKGSKTRECIYGKYSITINCVGGNTEKSEMKIAEINPTNKYYYEGGTKINYVRTGKKINLPELSDYFEETVVEEGRMVNRYVFTADYGAQWEITFDTPDGQCFAYVKYTNEETKDTGSNGRLTLTFDRDRTGEVYYQELKADITDFSIWKRGSDSQDTKVSPTSLIAGETYMFSLHYKTTGNSDTEALKLNIYEDERTVINYSEALTCGSVNVDLKVPQKYGYKPQEGAKTLKIEVLNGSQIVGSAMYDIAVEPADVQKKELKFMETPLNRAYSGLVGKDVSRVHILSDGNATKYITSGSTPLYYDGYGRWEPVEAKETEALLALTGGTNKDGKIDLTTLKGVDGTGALYGFDGEKWVKEKDNGFNVVTTFVQAFFVGDKIIGVKKGGNTGGQLCVGTQGETAIEWIAEESLSNCYSLLLGDDGKAYATTYEGALYQYTDNVWKKLRDATNYPAKVLAASSEQDIWISAQIGASKAKIMHWNGQNWEECNTPTAMKELPTGILVDEGEMYCIYFGSIWRSTDNGETWKRQIIESSGDAESTLTGIQKTGKGIFYLGTAGAFYYEGTALGETAASSNEYNERTVRVGVVGSSPSKGTSISYAGKVTVDNQFDLTPYLTYYRYGGDADEKTAAKVWGPYNKDTGTGFKYPTAMHAVVAMLLKNKCDFTETTTYTYNGKTYEVPAILDAQANMNGGIYVAMAGGIREFDDGNMSGWMYTVNGEYPNLGLSQWSLQDGDVIVLRYVTKYSGGSASEGSPTRLTTKEYGDQAEIEIDPGKTLTFHCEVQTGTSLYDDAEMAFLYVDGRRYYTYENGEKKTAMTDEYGILKMTFDKEGVYEIYGYKKGVNAQSNIITVRVGKGNVKPEIQLQASATRCTPNEKVTLTVTDLEGKPISGAMLYYGKGDDNLKDADKKDIVTDDNGQATVSFADKGTYTIYAKGEETKASQTVSIVVADEVGDIKTAMSDALTLANTRADKLTGKTPWNSIALDRQTKGDYTSGTLNELVQEIGSSIEANSGTQYELVTDYAKWVLAIQAAGGDPSSLVYKDTKINLLEKIYNYHVRLNDGTVKNIYAQGLNAPIWSLIALDSVPETVPSDARYSKADLVKYIVRAQHSDGSFSLDGSGSGDVDMTAMALQALAKHKGESGVDKAIEKAVDWLAEQQKEDGGFASYYSTENSESTAQTIIALTALGIDPAGEKFNTETGKTMLDALLYYHLGDGSFAHMANTSGVLTANDMASEQAHLALTAYDRYVKNSDALYDMSSITRVDRYAPVITTDLRTYTTNDKTVSFTVSAVDATDGAVTPTVAFNRTENENYTTIEPKDGKYTVTVDWSDEKLKRQTVYIRITATDKAGNTAVEKYAVTYSMFKVVDSISLPEGVQTAKVGEPLNLTATVTPDEANNKTLEWKSSDPTIATVDENGTVTALKSGMVTITATTCDGSNLSAECKVVCELPQSQQVDDKTIKVNFTLMGDSAHGETKPYHTLKNNNLTTWIKTTTVTVEKGSSVGDVFSQVLTKNGYSFEGLSKNYISYITTPAGVRMGEFTNGKLSGWMYTVNGHHPEVGLNSYILTNGDNIIWHYTDDYTVEEGSERWNTKTEETKPVTTDTASGSTATTAPTETKVTEKTNADGTKEKTATVTVSTDNQTEIIKQAADKKSTEIVLEVATTDTSGAQNVQLQLNVSFVKNVSEKTDAALTVNTENGTISLDQDTIKTVLSEAKGATITLDVNRVEKPTEVQKKAAGESGQILNLTVKSGGKTISDFKTGKVTVTVAIQAALQNKRVAAIHIAEDGKIEQMPGRSREVNGMRCFEFTTSHFSDFALVDADELGLETEDEIDAAALVAKLTPVARSAKTAKGSIKVTTSLDKSDKAIISDLKAAGYTVKYRFYRSTKKAAGYKSATTKKASTYTNTTGKKGTKYFYKVQVRVYDASGKLAAKTTLKQCKYASRKF